jgi:hypothetical protein
MATVAAIWRRLFQVDGRLAHIREITLLGGAYFIYMIVRKVIIPHAGDIGFENAAGVVDFERNLGFFWELHFQDWAKDFGKGIFVFFNYVYIVTYFPVILTGALIFYLKDRKRYFYYRNLILLTFVVALVIFASFPLAPPRMLGHIGFLDSIASFGPTWYESREATAYYNAFAAMPSLHFSWTVIFGVLFWRTGPWYLKLLGVFYPTMTFFAITITGNHYIVDAIAGVVMVVIVFLIYERLIRTGRAARAVKLAWATAGSVLRRAE